MKTKLDTRQMKINARDSVRVIHESNVATLAGGAPDTVDSVLLAVGDRILVNGQTAKAENGIYEVTILGTGADGTWARVIEMDEDAEVRYGDTLCVVEGTVRARTAWIQEEADPLVVGTDAQEWFKKADTGLIASDHVFNETPTGTINGTNKIFTTASVFVAGTLRVYLNGQRLVEGATEDYEETDTDEITMADAPKSAPGNPDVIIVDYIK
jgi:hypothetical protein